MSVPQHKSRRPWLRRLWGSGILATCTALLGGCAYSAPFRTTAMGREGSIPSDQAVVVSISAAEHKKGQRKEFFRDTRRVLAELANQPGLIGYSFRFEVFGNEAWTMTAWINEEARDTFVQSPAHLIAVRRSGQTAQRLRFVTLNLPRSSLPMTWKDAMSLTENASPLESPSGNRSGADNDTDYEKRKEP